MQIGPRIRWDSHTLANLAKNVSPIAGALVGGPAGMLLAGGMSAVGDLGRGRNIGQALRGGVGNAALAYSGSHVLNALGYGDGQASSTIASNLASGPGEDWGAVNAGGTAGTAGTTANEVAHAASSPMGGLADKLKAMPFQDKLALGSTALQGIGGIAGGIAQGQQADFQRDQYSQMAPIRNQAMQQLGASMQAPQPFQFQSPFAQPQPQAQPHQPGQGLDPASQWAAILKARGLPGLQYGGR